MSKQKTLFYRNIKALFCPRTTCCDISCVSNVCKWIPWTARARIAHSPFCTCLGGVSECGILGFITPESQNTLAIVEGRSKTQGGGLLVEAGLDTCELVFSQNLFLVMAWSPRYDHVCVSSFQGSLILCDILTSGISVL